jgi:hypothetical protein
MKKEVFPIHNALIIVLITNVTTGFLCGNNSLQRDGSHFLISQNSAPEQFKEKLFQDKLNPDDFPERSLNMSVYHLAYASFPHCTRNVIACKICEINHF